MIITRDDLATVFISVSEYWYATRAVKYIMLNADIEHVAVFFFSGNITWVAISI